MHDPKNPAGFLFAPDYSDESEFDPDTAECVLPEEEDIHALSYYRQLDSKRTTRARVVLLSTIFLMLAGNLFLTWQMNQATMANVDQTRLDQVALNEHVQNHVASLETEVEKLRNEIRLLNQQFSDLKDTAVAEAR